MPKIEHAPSFLAQIARAVYHIGRTFAQRSKQVLIIKGIIFQIGILNPHIIARRVEKPRP